MSRELYAAGKGYVHFCALTIALPGRWEVRARMSNLYLASICQAVPEGKVTEIFWKGGRVQGRGQDGPSRNRWEMKSVQEICQNVKGDLSKRNLRLLNFSKPKGFWLCFLGLQIYFINQKLLYLYKTILDYLIKSSNYFVVSQKLHIVK